MGEFAIGSHRAMSATLGLMGMALAVAMGCGRGGQRVEGAGDTAASVEAPPAAQAPAAGREAAGGEPTDPKVIALGKDIFEGRIGGATCFTCHGQDAKGTPLAPDLTDAQWLHGDGSYSFIVNTVTSGVPTPKQYPGPMLPMGGASLTPDQVKAVTAYVHSLRSSS